jgi:hypothetical protein
MKRNAKVSKAVKSYANDIVNNIKQSNSNISIELDFSVLTNTNQTESAETAIIVTDIGIVVVRPDFKKKSAQAAIFKVGEAERLKKEGFEQEWIEKHGRVYGMLMPYNEDNVTVLSYYLSHKIDINK